MNCLKCSKKAVAEEFCKSHFFELVEKRAKEAIREIGWLRPGERVLLINDGTAAGIAANYLLQKAVGGLPLKITARKVPGLLAELNKFDRIILPYSIEDKVEMFLGQMFEGKKLKKGKKELWLVEHLSDGEIELFLKLKGLKFKQKKKSKIGLLLAKLEQRLPKTKFALARASETFRKIIENI